MDIIEHNKSFLRAQILMELNKKPLDYFVQAGQEVAKILNPWLTSLIMRPLSVAIFENFNKEIVTLFIKEIIESLGIDCYQPQMQENKTLLFLNNKKKSLICAQECHVIFVPGLAFDKKGNRLGRGQGFFDKTFMQLTQSLPKPIIIGLATDLQIVDNIPIKEHDYKMDFICSPSLGFFNVKTGIV